MPNSDIPQTSSPCVTTPSKKKGLQLIGIVAFCVLLLYGCVQFLPSTGTDASPWRANYFLGKNFSVPETATDIYYFTDWAAAEAEFGITENDFLSWCKPNGWEPEPIDKPVKYFYPVWGPKEDGRLVDRGYYCSAAGGNLVFDASQSRVVIYVSEFP